MNNYLKKLSTIFALCSGVGKCGVSVIRISGPCASSVIVSMTNMKKFPLCRFANLNTIVDPVTCEYLDKGIIIWFPSPNSYTGEDCCELQVHGSKAVVTSILFALSKINNFRLAEPGEFTRRAFYYGKLDLTEVEGLSDLIAAETELQRKHAFLQLDGVLSSLYHNWRINIIQNLSDIESVIDFSEEEIPDNLISKVELNTKNLQREILEFLSRNEKCSRLKDGIKIVIFGSPNTGKSSLFNALNGRSASIVTQIPGTTRDVVETMIDFDGYQVSIADTAGIRNETADIIEKQGIFRTYCYTAIADLLLIVVDISHYAEWYKKFDGKLSVANYLNYYINNLQINNDIRRTDYIIVLNKFDMVNDIFKKNDFTELNNLLVVSCKTNEGVSNLIRLIKTRLEQIYGNPSKENPVCSQIRHRHHLVECLSLLNSYVEMDKNKEENLPLAAEKLRLAARCIGEITGAVTTEEVLENIFTHFCIGK